MSKSHLDTIGVFHGQIKVDASMALILGIDGTAYPALSPLTPSGLGSSPHELVTGSCKVANFQTGIRKDVLLLGYPLATFKISRYTLAD